MAHLQWDDSYSVGIASLDAQHQGLFATAQRLHEAMLAGRAARIQQVILAELIAYGRSHFEREEHVMANAEFPGLEEHRNLHRAFLHQALAFQSQLRGSRGSLSIAMMEFLHAWMRDHLTGADAQYAAWIRDRSLKPKPLTISPIGERACRL